MPDFPVFMRNPVNRIDQESQYTEDIEGYVYDGADGSQMAFWTCHKDRISEEHSHEYDEYVVCVQGRYAVKIGDQEHVLTPGSELHIPPLTPHQGAAVAGTRTIHAFGAKRAQRQDSSS